MESGKNNQLDLVAEVRASLVSSGLLKNVEKFYDTDPLIKTAANQEAEVQRTYLNKYWNKQLFMAAVPTQQERFCLIPNGDPSSWLKLFQDKILPTLVSQSLPKG